ncbi:MAG: hypothetical protein IPM39_14875 [Chloroflexi bacterium]|nr:hypothetical protein [Chloroflexota bacterium]
MQESIVAQNDDLVTTSAEFPASVECIAYRPAGKRHPEQWRAKVDGRYIPITPASARLVIDLARDVTDYKYAGLARSAWRIGIPGDGGRRWWGYEFTDNDFGRFLVEAPQ